MATTLDKNGNEIINGMSTNLTPAQNQTITTNSLKQTTPVNLSTPQYSTSPSLDISTALADVTNMATQAKTAEEQAKQNAEQARGGIGSVYDILAGLQSEQGGKAKDTASTYESQGINKLFNQMSDLNVQAQGLQREAQAIPIQVQQESVGQGRTMAGAAPLEAGRLRENALKALSLGQQAAIVSGQYDKAKNYADQLVNAKYDQIKADIEAKKTNIEKYEKLVLTPAEKKLAEATKTRLDAELLANEKKAESEKDLQNLSLSIAKNGAPQNVVSKIANAKSFNEAVIAAAPYMQSLEDKADLNYKLAQTAKIYNDMRNDNATAGGNVAPENMLPFAQEYLATGKVPLGAPKGSQGAIMKYAKELPQAPGSMVSSVTGVANTTVGQAEQKDISRLYNVVKGINELKKLDQERIGGLAAGTVGKVFGSDAQSKYLAQRKAIVDDISRMQSGAALTESEVKFYEDYLPGRFSETLGLGQDSAKKIENFEKIMNEKLNNALKNNQLSVYGYSKIDLGGKEYTVGDLIQSNGVTGRVNPDGTITLVQ